MFKCISYLDKFKLLVPNFLAILKFLFRGSVTCHLWARRERGWNANQAQVEFHMILKVVFSILKHFPQLSQAWREGGGWNANQAGDEPLGNA